MWTISAAKIYTNAHFRNTIIAYFQCTMIWDAWIRMDSTVFKLGCSSSKCLYVFRVRVSVWMCVWNACELLFSLHAAKCESKGNQTYRHLSHHIQYIYLRIFSLTHTSWLTSTETETLFKCNIHHQSIQRRSSGTDGALKTHTYTMCALQSATLDRTDSNVYLCVCVPTFVFAWKCII